MTKTNVYTLIATALLGILLFVILQLARDLRTRVELEKPETQAAEFIRTDGRRRIANSDDLTRFLAERNIDAAAAIAASKDWRARHGYLGADLLLGITDEDAPFRRYEAFTDADLLLMSQAGNAAATQALAGRVVSVDPFAALELYTVAVSQGSTYALLRIGSLREIIGSTAATLGKLNELQREAPTPAMDFFAYTIAAIRDGGVAIIDNDMLSRIGRAELAMSAQQHAEACALSQTIFFEFGAARRKRGVAPLTIEPPPIFISVMEAGPELPCTATAQPVIPLLDLSECSINPVENFRGERVDLYICGPG